MDARTTVEDVEVSTLHWIGGERIESAGAFADISPIDETLVARVARGGEAHPGWTATFEILRPYPRQLLRVVYRRVDT